MRTWQRTWQDMQQAMAKDVAKDVVEDVVEDVPEEADMIMMAMSGLWPTSWPRSWSRPMAKAVREGVAEVPMAMNSQSMLSQNVEGELKKQRVLQFHTNNSPKLLWPRLRTHRLELGSSKLLGLSLICLPHKATLLVSGPEPNAQAQPYFLCCF